ncbi:DUF2536 family protein [Jeotgalibacillus soli]|uniref:DUF2536 domain-containing protein n=1 Tax=Jeotgalibacillus soli TaxID=889306 RepID=A0A0C2VJ26_9BACL|nr:DUF2536 family protein [Jeotgalibacillus soli]KIL44486.1 hypothetical protein KP78_34500 [Jeotgalibacillus soli]
MSFHVEMLKDKVEFYEAHSLSSLEKKINDQMEHNQAILLRVHSVSHQVTIDEKGRPYYTAVVHYKAI